MEKERDADSYGHLYHNLVDRILNGKGYSSQNQRQAAFNNAELPAFLSPLVDKVAHHAYKVTDGDIDIAKQSGISEDEVFELIICAAVGQASRQYQNGLQALSEAENEGGDHAS